MDIDVLNALVSGAIWRAEQLDDLGVETASAWLEVSRLEEALAKVLPAKQAEGRIARRGAVRAALKANDHVRAQTLVDSYVSETGIPKTLRANLRKMLKAEANGLSEDFPHAAKHHKANELQLLVNRLQLGGPFGLAA